MTDAHQSASATDSSNVFCFLHFYGLKAMGLLTALVSIAAAAGGPTPVVIYDQPGKARLASVFFQRVPTTGPNSECGDDVTLTGGPHSVSEIQIPLYLSPSGNQDPSLTITVSIRAMTPDGKPAATALWGHTEVLTPHGTLGKVTQFSVNVTPPNVPVPNHFFVGFVVNLDYPSPAWVAVGLGAAANVGSSDADYFWSVDPKSADHLTLGSGQSNLQMTIKE